MTYLLTAGIALITAIASIFGVYNYLPLSVLQPSPEARFGSSITTINGTDTLSSSRTTINDNFSALNSTKIENSTTSVASITTLANLSTIGTIASGIWNGTAIGVGYGGTGTTTPSSNQVILGNGSSGFKTVSGWGSANQVLTSGAGTAAPTWQTFSVDQSANYNWTGTNLFKNLSASSTVANPIVLNGLSFSTGSNRAASSTVLMEDGNGNLSFEPNYNRLLFSTTTAITTTQTASTTILAFTVPANTIGSNGMINCRFGGNVIASGVMLNINSTDNLWIEVAFGGATTTLQEGGATATQDSADFNLIAKGATNSQIFYFTGYGSNSNPFRFNPTGGTFATDSTVAKTLQIVVKGSSGSTYWAPQTIVCQTIR